jgi:hypothetical protein
MYTYQPDDKTLLVFGDIDYNSLEDYADRENITQIVFKSLTAEDYCYLPEL